MSDLPKIEPMKLSLRSEPFDHPEYLFELKHDGFRALAYISQIANASSFPGEGTFTDVSARSVKRWLD